jgi:hypothetical protein
MKAVSMGSTTFYSRRDISPSPVKQMIETNNIILYNRYKDDISLIHNHTNITAEEIHDNKNNVQFNLDFKNYL